MPKRSLVARKPFYIADQKAITAGSGAGATYKEGSATEKPHARLAKGGCFVDDGLSQMEQLLFLTEEYHLAHYRIGKA